MGIKIVEKSYKYRENKLALKENPPLYDKAISEVVKAIVVKLVLGIVILLVDEGDFPIIIHFI